MTHYMNLNSKPFRLMKEGRKTIELRLNDEKRQKIKVGDVIVFTENTSDRAQLAVRVIGLHGFSNFEQLYKELPLTKCGYLPEELQSASPEDMEEYYSEEKQRAYGVLGIEIEVMP